MAAQREWYEKDYYKVLGVSDDATPKDITKAYRKLAREQHPDTHPGDDAAEERFKEIVAPPTTCWATKPSARSTTRSASSARSAGFRAAARAARSASTSTSAGDGLGDMLGQMFGRGRRGGGPSAAGRSATRCRRRGDAHPRLRRRRAGPHHDAAPHQRRAVLAPVTAAAPSPGTQPEGVLELRRARRHRRQPGTVLVLVAVPRLRRPRRRHRAIRARHATARGIERRAREVQARIPAGVADGQKIRLKGRGAPGRNGGPAGDLIVECHVAPARLFGRDGNNLTVKRAGHIRRGCARRRHRRADARRRRR